MKRLLLLFCIFLFSSFIALSKTYTDYYPNGQIHYKFKKRNNALHGDYIYWHSNGNKAVEGKFKKGKREGLWQAWYENGNLCYERNFENGEENGLTKYYYENGQLQASGPYKENFRSGHWRIWDEDGSLRAEGKCKYGVFHGIWNFSDSINVSYYYGHKDTIDHIYKYLYLDKKSLCISKIQSLVSVDQLINGDKRFSIKINSQAWAIIERDFNLKSEYNGFFGYNSFQNYYINSRSGGHVDCSGVYLNNQKYGVFELLYQLYGFKLNPETLYKGYEVHQMAEYSNNLLYRKFYYSSGFKSNNTWHSTTEVYKIKKEIVKKLWERFDIKIISDYSDGLYKKMHYKYFNFRKKDTSLIFCNKKRYYDKKYKNNIFSNYIQYNETRKVPDSLMKKGVYYGSNKIWKGDTLFDIIPYGDKVIFYTVKGDTFFMNNNYGQIGLFNIKFPHCFDAEIRFSKWRGFNLDSIYLIKDSDTSFLLEMFLSNRENGTCKKYEMRFVKDLLYKNFAYKGIGFDEFSSPSLDVQYLSIVVPFNHVISKLDIYENGILKEKFLFDLGFLKEYRKY